MPLDRFLIAPQNTGLDKSQRPWLISDDAYEQLNNAYMFRGRIRKRFGSQYMVGNTGAVPGMEQYQSRLAIDLGLVSTGGTSISGVPILLGVTNGAGTLAGNTGVPTALGQRFLIGTLPTPAPASEILTVISAAVGAQPMATTGGSVTHTFNFATGAYNIVGAAALTNVYFYQIPYSAVGSATTDAATGNAYGMIPGNNIGALGQQFTIGTNIYTVVVANGAMLVVDAAGGVTGTGTFNIANGVFTITGAVGSPLATAILFYPALPVMGISIYENGQTNNEPTIAFDTSFAYQFTVNGWRRIVGENTLGASIWTGSNSQFFWTCSYRGPTPGTNYFYVTNNNPAEPNFMRYMDNNFIWYNFAPLTSSTAGNFVVTCQVIVGFQGSMILLNTVENSTVVANGLRYQNRARSSAPFISPIDANPIYPFINSLNDASYRGGALFDNTETQEAITSAEFIKNHLIVFYERSSWDFAYQNNYQSPFDWQKINTELGSQSTFSSVPFDREILTIGQVGVHSCTGANVERIDNNIPDDVFAIQQLNSGIARVQGIRDYKVEQVYWCMPLAQVSTANSNIFPNQVLVFNYKTRSWAYNTDSFTAFGYFEQQPQVTWGNTITAWQDMTTTWGDGNIQSNFRQILGGNQEGFVLLINPDIARNAGGLTITNMTAVNVFFGSVVTITAYNHNLPDQDIFTHQEEYILIENVLGALGPGTFTSLNGGIYAIQNVVDSNTIQIAVFFEIFDTYAGNGTIARVSNINILSKQWNPYAKTGQNVYVQKMNFLLDRIGSYTVYTPPALNPNPQILVDYYMSTSKYSILENSIPGQLASNGVLQTAPYDPTYYPQEGVQDRVWHTMPYNAEGNAMQIRMFWNADQISNPAISLVDFQLHAIEMETMPTSYRIG